MNKCKDCKFMTKKKGSMPKKRICEVTPVKNDELVLSWIVEVNPESKACDSFERKEE